MPTYLWSGKNSSGEPATERVTADTPEEAQAILQSRGWTELRRETSEINDFVQQQMDAASDPENQVELTPEEEKAYLKGTAPGFWTNWWKAERESAGTHLLLALWFAVSVYRHKMWSIIISGGLLLGLGLLFPVIHWWFSRTSELFEKLHQARNWRRWPEVLACLEALKRVQESRGMGIGEAEMVRYEALARAGLGKLDEAVSQFTQVADKTNMPRWLYYSHLSSIYTVAERYDQGLDCYRQALEQTTEKGIVCIDYGTYLVTRFNRPAEARQLLAQAEATPLPTVAAGHVAALRGVIAVRERDFATAERHMSEALTFFEQHAKRKRFIFEPTLLLTQGYLALIHAALGHQKAAREYFAKSEKYLATIRMDDLLADCRAQMNFG